MSLSYHYLTLLDLCRIFFAMSIVSANSAWRNNIYCRGLHLFPGAISLYVLCNMMFACLSILFLIYILPFLAIFKSVLMYIIFMNIKIKTKSYSACKFTILLYICICSVWLYIYISSAGREYNQWSDVFRDALMKEFGKFIYRSSVEPMPCKFFSCIISISRNISNSFL